MPKHSLSFGIVALAAAALVLPGEAQANHENRYFGFGYQPFPYAYPPPPVIYEPPQGVREVAPGVFEYQVAPGRWVRVRPDHRYRSRWGNRPRGSQQPREALRPPGPPPVPTAKPEEPDDPAVTVRSAPAATAPVQSAARPPLQPEPQGEPQPAAPSATASTSGSRISCEDAAGIVERFGFSDVKSTSCSGEVYGFEADRDGTAYSIKLSAADGELTEVRKR